jgi:hypothetical protein
MSWYSTPLQPLDPVVQSQTPKPPIRFIRDNFAGTGQNSYIKPPAQDQSMWQSLLNVQPITQGILNQRWGYLNFANNFTTGLPIVSISYISGNTYATVFVASTAGLSGGQTVVISGNSNANFNGTFVINLITSGTTFTIGFFFIGSQSGTGGTLTVPQPIVGINRLYDFQSDALGTRAIIAAGLKNIIAFSESGSTYNPSIFVPAAANGIIRSVTSRNYQYFCDGDNALNPSTHLTGDSLKWNGAASGGVTNIGIVNTDVTVNNTGGSTGNTYGPNTGSNASDLNDASNPWLNVSAVFLNNPATPASVSCYEQINGFLKPNGLYGYTITNNHSTSDSIKTTGYGFNAISGQGIAGVQVAITYAASNTSNNDFTPTPRLVATMVKNNTSTGASRTLDLNLDGGVHTLTFGSATDLWGTSFVPADIVNTQFGCQFYAASGFVPPRPLVDDPTGTASIQVKVQYITITIFIAGNSGTSTSSGNGVGILGGVPGGQVNLTLGRIYYLVPNNSSTGHFGDLSSASGSTGASTNSEFNLILATYNDPQVDYKYVLGTSDGGDPSILYEVSVLVPGLTVSSWAIAANVVTFTGVYTGPQFATGATVTVGGLSHGSYMNNFLFTVTGATGTTFTAAFTHANDSSTEIGVVAPASSGPGGTTVAGTFAIPNSVTYVVDNTPDPTLVLNQPLVFTDTFGNEFGLTLNTPPPAGNLIVKHQGRLWMAGVPNATHSVFFSKAVAELTLPNGFIAGKYEEAWPGSNYFDVSDGAESVSGFLSDGTTLYFGTQNHIYRLLGSAPSTFQEPQIVHPQVGLINQEVAKITFMQGAPSGAIWMTPDFRVIQSDFNTYVDIGTPVQDILNSLQPTAPSLAHAAFVADGEFELYMLAVPYKQSTYCDTKLIFDLRSRHWFVWQPAGGSLSILYNITQDAVPQWLFIGGTTSGNNTPFAMGTGNVINIYDANTTTDNGTAIPVTATTTWMNLGEPTRRKLLNEVQVYGNTAMTMNVYGANNLLNFSSNLRPVVYNRTLRESPFGVWTLYLTGDKTRHRYYQFTFQSSNGQIPFLGSYAIAVTPLDDI